MALKVEKKTEIIANEENLIAKNPGILIKKIYECSRRLSIDNALAVYMSEPGHYRGNVIKTPGIT